MGEIKIRVFPTAAAVTEAAAQQIIQSAAAAIERTGSFCVGLSGGHTPRPLYELLSDDRYIRLIDWPKVHIYFCDERCVPPTDEQSNFRLASQTLLDFIPIPPPNINRIRGEADPQVAAIKYGQLLKTVFGDGGLDLALLGMGADGHTASIFPHSNALHETHHQCMAVFVEKLNAWRVTMTPVFLNRSREIIVLVTGAEKAQRVQQALEGERNPESQPIQLIDPPDGQVLWYMDAAAAGM